MVCPASLLLAAGTAPLIGPPPALQDPALPPPAGYQAPEAVLAEVQALAGRAGVDTLRLATTHGGRDLLLAAFGTRDGGDRPAVLVLADPSGERPVASQVALALCHHLAAGSPLLERADVYVVPVANPDAAASVFSGGEARRGAPVDEDRDGRVDEDGPDDLDGDGRALWMRVPDSSGDHVADPVDARSTREADREKGEAAVYRLEREGRDDDGDRRSSEDGAGGVALDANWPHRWPQHTPEGGPYPLSAPENRALADFALAHPRISLVLVLGAEDNLADPPKGVERTDRHSQEPPESDAALLAVLGERLYADWETEPRGADHTDGNFADWATFQLGALTLESAVWSPPFAEVDAEDASDDVKLLQWNDDVYAGAGFRNWQPFEHETLGAVEIGGWLPLVLHNPPASELPALGARYAAFLDSLAADLPRLAWRDAGTEDLGGGVYDVRLELVNEALLPTVSSMGQRTRRALPIRVELELPDGGALLGGRRYQTVDRLAGLGGERELRWLVRLPEGGVAHVRAHSTTAGTAVAPIGENE